MPLTKYQMVRSAPRARMLLLAVLPLAMTQVLAQEMEHSQSEIANADTLDTVVVTGSRIRSPNVEAVNPITSLSFEHLAATGNTNLQEIVNNIGALVGSDTDNEISTGESTINLRNLGTNRTLVLVDGQRVVGGVAGSSTVDLNAIPLAMIERVDVLTGGASAIYGADAVTGVVNFILKRNFEGLALDGQYGNAQKGDFRDQQYSLTFGRNFNEGRGNVTIGYTWGERPLTLATSRRAASVDLHEQVNNLAGDSQFTLVSGTQDSFFTDGGALFDPFGSFSGGFLGNGQPFNHGTPMGGYGGTTELGGDGLASWKMFSQGLRPSNERHLLTIKGRYEVSQSFQPYASINYAKVNSRSIEQESLAFGMAVNPDNAFLPPEVLAAAAGAPIFFNRWDIDAGFRDYSIDKKTSRLILGANGEFGERFRYDVSANMGRLERLATLYNNRMQDRYIAAIDSVVDPVSGNVVCRSNLDPGSFNRLGADAFDTVFDPSLGAVTFTPGSNSGCIPFNPFLAGVASNQAAIDWIWIPTTNRTVNRQMVLNGYIGFDTGGWFELPGGAIEVVAGAEYRREDSSQLFDAFTGSPRAVAFENDNGTDLYGKFHVSEVFAELSMPVFHDLNPWLRALNLDMAFRVSDYSHIGMTRTWKAGFNFATIGGVSLRGTASSAVRAPNIEDLYTARRNVSTGLGSRDPCALPNLGLGTPFRQANCAQDLTALGVDPATFMSGNPSYFTAIRGGNPNLSEETARTVTFGVVWQAPFTRGLTLSLDYFDIKINDAIMSVTESSLFNACYDAPSLNNLFCGLIAREQGTGLPSYAEVAPVNVANLRTSGVEFALAHTFSPAALGTFRQVLNVTWLERLDIQKSLLPVLTDDKGLFNTDLGGSSPEWTAGWQLAWVRGNWDASYGFNYSSKTLRSPPLVNAQRGNARNIIDAPYVKAYVNHDLNIGYFAGVNTRLYAGVRNLTNEYPDKVRGSLNGPSGRQGYAGRTFYVGFNLLFDAMFR